MDSRNKVEETKLEVNIKCKSGIKKKKKNSTSCKTGWRHAKKSNGHSLKRGGKIKNDCKKLKL